MTLVAIFTTLVFLLFGIPLLVPFQFFVIVVYTLRSINHTHLDLHDNQIKSMHELKIQAGLVSFKINFHIASLECRPSLSLTVKHEYTV